MPRSYLQQLDDRLGAVAIQGIQRTSVGGGSLDVPRIETDLPSTKSLKIDNQPLPGFSPAIFDYIVTLPAGTTEVPDVRPHDRRHLVETCPASNVNGNTVLILRDRHDPTQSVRYTIRFVTTP